MRHSAASLLTTAFIAAKDHAQRNKHGLPIYTVPEDTRSTIAVKKTFYNLEIEISSPPFNVNHNTAYYLQFVLLVWNGENDLCRHTEESTAWIPIRTKLQNM